MLVVTWNIELGMNLDLAARELHEISELRDADLVLLQEMDPCGAETMAEKLGMYYEYSAAAPHPKTGRPFGNAVLSRKPIDAWAHVPLPHTAPVQGQPRSATRATLQLNGVAATVYSVHGEIPVLPLVRRSRQFRTVADDAAVSPAEIVIVGGDFNTVTPRGVRSLTTAMSRGSLASADRDGEPTFVWIGRPLRLDHIFSRGVRVVESGVGSQATASDHYPVWARFEHEPTHDPEPR